MGNDSMAWVISADTTALTVTGLQPYTDYSVRVRYVNKIGAGNYGAEVVFRTAQDGKLLHPFTQGVIFRRGP